MRTEGLLCLRLSAIQSHHPCLGLSQRIIRLFLVSMMKEASFVSAAIKKQEWILPSFFF